jgi:hypothetical protein
VTSWGRYVVTIDPASCNVPQPGMEVMVSADSMALWLASGEACSLSSSAYVDSTPRAQRMTGICDVSMEPRG